VYQLRLGAEDQDPDAKLLLGAKSVETLVSNVYRPALAEFLAAKPGIFSFCASIAQQVPIYQFHRPVTFEAMPEVLRYLENHFSDEK
jgi:hypothetical protein